MAQRGSSVSEVFRRKNRLRLPQEKIAKNCGNLSKRTALSRNKSAIGRFEDLTAKFSGVKTVFWLTIMSQSKKAKVNLPKSVINKRVTIFTVNVAYQYCSSRINGGVSILFLLSIVCQFSFVVEMKDNHE